MSVVEDVLLEVQGLINGENTSFQDLKQFLEKKSGKTVQKVLFKDDEGDFVTVTSNIEVREAFKFQNAGHISLRLHLEDSALSPKSKLNADIAKIMKCVNFDVEPEKPSECKKECDDASKNPVWHRHVICDHCDQDIKGIRYKCSQCPDYDLCEKCEAENFPSKIHDPQHVFLKIYIPVKVHLRATLPNFYQRTQLFHNYPFHCRGANQSESGENQSQSQNQRGCPPLIAINHRLDQVEKQLQEVQKLVQQQNPVPVVLPTSVAAPDEHLKSNLEARKVMKQQRKQVLLQMKEEKRKIKMAQKEERMKLKQRLNSEMPPPQCKVEIEQPAPEQAKVEAEQPSPVPPKIEIEESSPVLSPQTIIECLYKEFDKKPEAPVEKENPQLLTLMSMGWNDKELNNRLLTKYNGDLLRVIDDLLRLS